MKRFIPAAAVIISIVLFFVLLPAAAKEGIVDFVGRYYLRNGRTETVHLEIWHIDSFDGGVNSRAEWLRKRAGEFEKANKGIYISVKAYTYQTARDLIATGRVPELISCGGRVWERAFFVPVNAPEGVEAELIRACDGYAVPYAVGGYMLFTGENADGGNVAYSSQKAVERFNLKVKTQCDADSLESYRRFIAGKADTLVGTQRDVYRLKARDDCEWNAVPLKTEDGTAWTDMVQCMFALVQNEAAEKFMHFLTSRRVQSKLTGIGLVSVRSDTLIYDENTPMGALERALHTRLQVENIFS